MSKPTLMPVSRRQQFNVMLPRATIAAIQAQATPQTPDWLVVVKAFTPELYQKLTQKNTPTTLTVE